MARRGDGYRTQRLAKRRSARWRGYQNLALYVLAALVAFGAVVGGVRVARAMRAEHVPPSQTSYIALVTVGKGEARRAPIAALLVHDVNAGTTTLYTIPAALLLNGPNGEYVMAGDVLARGELKHHVERLIKAPVSYVLRLSYADLVRLSGAGDLRVTAVKPFGLQIDGSTHGYKGTFRLPASLLPAVLGADGHGGADQANAEQSFLAAALKSGSLAPDDARDAAVDGAAKAQDAQSTDDSHELLDALVSGRTSVQRLPSTGATAEGQFAWRPERQAITARVTRNAKGFNAPYTVVVENGSGALGIGRRVSQRLAVLNVNLPAVRNASSFDYGTTQILAGAKAFGVATQVRGILRRGVVLKGNGVPDTTVVVVVGKDLTAKDLQ